MRYEDIELPRNSATGPVIGIAGAAAAFGLVWHIWWLAALGVLAVIAAVIARSFARDVHRIVPAAEVERRPQQLAAHRIGRPRHPARVGDDLGQPGPGPGAA